MTATAIKTDRTRRLISKLVRRELGLSGSPYPIVFVDGFAAPALKGRSYYWTTPSGKTEVSHPNAYGWPTVYHASTRRIEVGKGWVCQALAAHWADERDVAALLTPKAVRPAGNVRFDAEGKFTIDPSGN